MTTNASASSADAAAAAVTELLQPVEVAPKRAPQNKKDACTWFANSKCSAPRGCEACLNTALRDQQCGVAPSGVCTDMGPLAASVGLDSSLTSFPSANFTYCEAADAVCRDCKVAWTQEFKVTGVYPLGKLCQGERGCVCLSQCESPSFSAKVITSECSLFGETAGVTKQIYTGMCALGLVVIAYSIYRAWQREKVDEDLARERRERQEQRRLRRAAQRGVKGTGRLSLTGWKALQEKLLETERELRGRGSARASRGGDDGANELPADRIPDEVPIAARAALASATGSLASATGSPAPADESEEVVAIRIA